MHGTPPGAPLGLPTENLGTKTSLALLTVSLSPLTVLRPLYEPSTAEPVDFAFDYLNPAGQRMLRLSEQPEISFLTRFPQARESGAFACCCSVLATGESNYFEVDYPIDGPDNCLYMVAQRQGGRLAVSFTGRTSQTRAAREAALRVHAREAHRARADAEQQHANLVRFLSKTKAAICVLRGAAHVLDYCNPSFERLFSGRALPPGQPLAEVFPTAIAQGLVSALNGVYNTGSSYFAVERELTIKQPVGLHYFTFSFDAYQEHGHTVGVSIFAYDVTEVVLARRQNNALQADALAAAQRQAQERATFHQVFEQTPAAICLLREPRHCVEYLNPAYQQLFVGRELLGRSLVDAVPEAEAQGYVALLDEVYRTGKTYFGTEMPLVLTDPGGGPPTTTYFTFTFQAFQENGQTAGISVFAYDVTEQVVARGQMQALRLEGARTNQQLLRSNTDLDTFIYTASHDLRTPIGNIEGLLGALRDELPAEALATGIVKVLLDRMQGSVERFQLTIAQLTDVAKLQQAHSHPAEPVDLAALVEDLRLDLTAELSPAGAALTVEVAMCPYVSFAPKNLRSIVYNLLSNALKYRHPTRPPVVELRCRRTASAVLLEVQDNGLGLTAIQQTQLFGLFQRLHDHVAGTGIGLYMVKRIVENAGGTIAVRSQIGEGSTFTITLPSGE